MEITFKIPTSEFSLAVFEKIQDFIRKGEIGEVVISVNAKKKKANTEMTKEAFFQKIDKAIEDVENDNNVVRFSPEEFEQFILTK